MAAEVSRRYLTAMAIGVNRRYLNLFESWQRIRIFR